ncbi:MAG: isocitrate/isopropylmalate family dehydrogenase [Proteobacteria bacterium]|nr:isocitrate/isopropylmalate family dehydrogenase [Pseudomonadota bacterium]
MIYIGRAVIKTTPATLIEGDGIGPEILDATIEILDALGAKFEWTRFKAGMSAFEEFGDPLPQSLIENIHKTRLAIKAPLETPIGEGFRSANVRLREEFKLYANVRPAISYLHNRRQYDNIDVVLIRENTQGFYVGVEHYIPIDDDPKAVAEASGIMTRSGCRKIAKYTFDYAIKNNRKKITIVHKANILKKLTGLFLETALEVGKEYEGRLEIEDRIVDNTAMQLVINPQQFDMILTTNMFGDILSDEIAGLIGGLGLAPGGNIGKDAAIFEAVHGTAPDIAGKGIANPTALLLAAAMMLDHVDEKPRGDQLRYAIKECLKDSKTRTGDLGGTASTKEYTAAIICHLN